MNSYCTIYVVRHAQSEANANKILGGNYPLTAFGEKQAGDRGASLFHVPFEHVYASDLIRAKRTAEIIALERDIAVKTNKFLRERFFGKLDGRLLSEIKTELEDWTTRAQQASENDALVSENTNGIENDVSLIGRYFTFLRQVSIANVNKNILVVSHSNVMRTLLVHLGFAKHSELGRGSIENTGYFILTSDGTDFYVKETVGIHKKSV